MDKVQCYSKSVIEIIEFAKILNKKDSLPSSGLKRNSVYYSLITYINHTIALFISEEYDDVALFIKRADTEIKSLKTKKYLQKYFTLCEQHLQILSCYLLQNKLISENCIEFIPDRFKN